MAISHDADSREAELLSCGDADVVLKPVRKWPRLSAAVNIFASSISGGLVALPQSFQRASLVPGLLLMLLVAFTTGCSIVTLTYISDRTGGLRSYEAVVKLLAGSVAAKCIGFVISFFLTCVLGASFVIIRGFLQSITSAAFAPIGTACIGAFVVFPLALATSIERLSFGNICSLSGFSFLVSVLLGNGILKMMGEPVDSGAWWSLSSEDVVEQLTPSVSIIMYSFGCQLQAWDVLEDLKAASPNVPPNSNVLPAVAAAMFGMFCLFSLMGIFGVCAFPGQEVKSDILGMADNLPVGGVAHVAMMVGVVLSAPLIVFPTRSGVCDLCVPVVGVARIRAAWFHTTVTAAIIATAVAIALAVDDLVTLLRLLGAFIYAPICFVIPAIALLVLKPNSVAATQEIWVRAMSVWLLVIGVGTMAINLYEYGFVM